MKKTAQIEKIILDVLSDGECHSSSEFKEKINAVNPELLAVNNSLSSILYQMRVKKRLIDKRGNRLYISQSSVEKLNEESDDNSNDYALMLELWRKFYRHNNPLIYASYEMNYREFAKGKKMYELNKEIEQLIKSHMISN